MKGDGWGELKRGNGDYVKGEGALVLIYYCYL